MFTLFRTIVCILESNVRFGTKQTLKYSIGKLDAALAAWRRQMKRHVPVSQMVAPGVAGPGSNSACQPHAPVSLNPRSAMKKLR